MTVKTPQPPPLPDELDRLLRRLRLPYVSPTTRSSMGRMTASWS